MIIEPSGVISHLLYIVLLRKEIIIKMHSPTIEHAIVFHLLVS